MPPIIELVHSATVALLAMLGCAALLALTLPRVLELSGRRRELLLGAMFGAMAAACMLASFPIVPGIPGDLRNVVVATAALFAGPLGGLVAAAIAALARAWFGTFVWGGVLGIAIACALGLGARRLWGAPQAMNSIPRTIAIAVVLALANSVLPLLGPWNARAWYIAQAILAGALITYIPAMIVLCRFVDLSVRRIEDRRELRRYADHQTVLTAELSHRVKNVLAIVQSLAIASVSRASSLADFRASFEGRLAALADAHGLLLRTDWQGVTLAELVEGALAPYAFEAAERVTVSGPRVELGPRQGVSLALVFHELATNAAKYGGLAGGQGSVEVRWTANDDRVALSWREECAGSPPAMAADGFGTRLVKRSVANDLRGSAERDMGPRGVSWSLAFEIHEAAAILPQREERRPASA
ncbi:MAG TPA: sensor histidine kinase [Sphingomonas sp.]|nr:sensor histidine kinase [Sphingomonas sp.]